MRLFMIYFILSEPVIDCVWGKWGEYSKCSRSCMKTRERSKAVKAKNGGLDCTGLAKETKKCNKKDCGKSQNFLPVYII